MLENAPAEAMYCILDQRPIPPERVRKRAVTCSPECARKLVAVRRAMTDEKRCRYCNAPSTPAERKLFAQWRRERGQLKRGRPKAEPVASEGGAL